MVTPSGRGSSASANPRCVIFVLMSSTASSTTCLNLQPQTLVMRDSHFLSHGKLDETKDSEVSPLWYYSIFVLFPCHWLGVSISTLCRLLCCCWLWPVSVQCNPLLSWFDLGNYSLLGRDWADTGAREPDGVNDPPATLQQRSTTNSVLVSGESMQFCCHAIWLLAVCKFPWSAMQQHFSCSNLFFCHKILYNLNCSIVVKSQRLRKRFMQWCYPNLHHQLEIIDDEMGHQNNFLFRLNHLSLYVEFFRHFENEVWRSKTQSDICTTIFRCGGISSIRLWVSVSNYFVQ